MSGFSLVLVLWMAMVAQTVLSTSDMDYYSADFQMMAAPGVDCRACGNECQVKCGTKLFRPCCFHFARKKRQGLEEMNDFTTDGSSSIELNDACSPSSPRLISTVLDPLCK